jgi:hypothetical protein
VSDFSLPVYESYVSLCRELKLTTPHRRGDWALNLKTSQLGQSPDEPWAWSDRYPEAWLPTLSDWLEMLEEARFGRVQFDNQRLAELGVLNPENLGPWSALGDRDDFRTAPGNTNEVVAGAWAYGCGPTREEAAARLWMAVTKSTPPPQGPRKP